MSEEIKGEYPFAELVKRQHRQPRGRGRPLKGVRRRLDLPLKGNGRPEPSHWLLDKPR